MNHNKISTGEQYRRNGVIKDVLRGAGVDFTGDKISDSGKIVAESLSEAAIRMKDRIEESYPEGIALLQQAGVELTDVNTL